MISIFKNYDNSIWVILVKKPKQGYGKKNPTFKFVTISFFTLKPTPLGLGNCSLLSFCETGLRYFCSLFTGTKDEFVPYATELFMPKNQNYLLEKADLRFFLSYGLRTTIKITIFSTFYVTDNFSNSYS